MTSKEEKLTTTQEGSIFGAIMWPLSAWLIVCAVMILLGPYLWSVPFVGRHIKAGEWLTLLPVVAIWLLFSCRRRHFGLGRTFLSCIIFFWSSSAVVWLAFVSSEFHSGRNIMSVVYGFAVYPLCFALSASVVGVGVYILTNFLMRRKVE